MLWSMIDAFAWGFMQGLGFWIAGVIVAGSSAALAVAGVVYFSRKGRKP